MHIEDELKQALRAEDPGAAFTQRVLARAREERSRTSSSTSAPHTATTAATATPVATAVDRRDAHAGASTPSQVAPQPTSWRSARTTRRLIAAVAASLALTAAGAQYWRHVQYVAEGERARAQVLTALRLTSEKLNQVHDAITESSEAR